MTVRSLLWVDFRANFSGPDLFHSLPKTLSAQRLCDPPDLLDAIQKWQPWAICFEFDIPDNRGLATLARAKDNFSSLPIVMLSEKHGKTSADSAFRQCVWDYLVKPVSVRRLCNCLASIEKAVSSTELPPGHAQQASVSPSLAAGNPLPKSTLAPAICYVNTNYSEKLCQATAARLCDLSPFQFSRSFRKAHGLTFRDFVVRMRIERAAELMKQSQVSVTEAAFVVGFNDLSHFARMFRRQLGVSPSHYRLADYRLEDKHSQMPLFPLDGQRNR